MCYLKQLVTLCIKCIMFVSLPVNLAASPTYYFEHLGTEDGLSSDVILDIIQDKQGFLWFCTEDGLNRYDGYAFETYRKDYFDANSLSDNDITCIAEDQHERLWIGTRNRGISIFDKSDGSFQTLSTTEGYIRLPSDYIRALYSDSSGNMWIGTENFGVLKIKSCGEMVIYRTKQPNLASLVNIRTIFEDADGRIWIGSWNNGLLYYDLDNDTFIQVHLPWSGEVAGEPVTAIHQDAEGRYWIGSWAHGLFVMQGSVEGGFEITRHPYIHKKYYAEKQDAMAGNIIFSITEDRNGNIWIGSNNSVAVFEHGNTDVPHLIDTDVNCPFTPNNSQIFKVYTDREGIVWLGTRGSGIHKVNTDRFRIFSHHVPQSPSNIFKETAVFSIFEKNETEVFLGVKSEGFYVFNRETGLFTSYRQIPLYEHLPDNFNTVYAFQRDHKGRIWAGTRYHGLFLFDHENEAIIQMSEVFSGLNIRKVYTIKKDIDNNMWVGTDTGLYIFKLTPETHAEYELLHFVSSSADNQSISGNHVTNILQDSRGHYWIGTLNNGLNRFKGIFPGRDMVFERFVTDPFDSVSIPSNRINDIMEDSRGRIWLGTDGGGGLSVLDPVTNEFVSFTKGNGLIGDHVFSILEDSDSLLWLSTNRGVLRLDARDLNLPVFTYYSVADGLQGNVYIRGAKMIASDGKYVFGGYNGFNVFIPENAQTDDCVTPEVAITRIMFGNEIVKFNPEATEPLLVSNRDKVLAVHYTVLSYKDPENNRFAIKLEGFDDDWNYRDASNRQAVYTNLKRGKYALHIKASNSNGTWSDEIVTLNFIVKPALMASGLAFAIYGILFILITFSLARIWMFRINMKQQLQLERIEQKRIQQVHQHKLRSFANLSHELLTPLSVITCVLDSPNNANMISGDSQRLMKKNLNRLKKLIDQLLLMRKIDIGYMKLSVREGDLHNLLTDIHKSFQPLASNKGLDFTYKSSDDDLMGYFDPEKVEMIVQNLLSNAVKFTDSGSVHMHCRAFFHGEQKWAQISISDTGCGISEHNLDRIFERFTRINEKMAVPGMGIGLDIVNNLCRIHKGHVNVRSVPGKNSTFTFEIPLDKNNYLTNEIATQLSLYPHNEPERKKAEHDPTIKQPAEMLSDKPGVSHKKSILLVEDNDDLRQILVQSLSAYFAVEEAENGSAAFEMAKHLSPDLIVSDVIMPEMNGFELCNKIKSDFETSHIPVVLLTAKTDEDSKTEAYSYGADSYITKPVNLDMLVTRINGILDAREGLKDYYRRRCVFAPEINNIKLPPLDETFIKRATKLIEDNIENPEFNIQTLTIEMATSKSMLYRKFNKLLGITPNDMIKNIRIKYAAEMLAKGVYTVSEVAYSIGFSDLSYFGKCFKKAYGVSPTEFKEQPAAH